LELRRKSLETDEGESACNEDKNETEQSQLTFKYNNVSQDGEAGSRIESGGQWQEESEMVVLF
jgi:hypothetical protein